MPLLSYNQCMLRIRCRRNPHPGAKPGLHDNLSDPPRKPDFTFSAPFSPRRPRIHPPAMPIPQRPYRLCRHPSPPPPRPPPSRERAPPWRAGRDVRARRRAGSRNTPPDAHLSTIAARPPPPPRAAAVGECEKARRCNSPPRPQPADAPRASPPPPPPRAAAVCERRLARVSRAPRAGPSTAPAVPDRNPSLCSRR